MKLLLTIAAVFLVAVGCSESRLPTEAELSLQPRFEIGVMQGGCPSPFTLAYAYDADGVAADRNDDGLACYLTHGRTEGEFESIFGITWTDNNVPLSQIGGCPNGFELTLTKFDPINDRNGDGHYCIRVTSNGSTIVIDNNHRN